MELNREQIIRVFECCISSKNATDCISNKCPLCSPYDDEFCVDDIAFAQMGLQIYKELTEEIEDLKAIAEGYQKQFEDCAEDRAKLTIDLEAMRGAANSYKMHNKELTEENERLREQNERYSELEDGCYVTGYKNIKADTVREMQERLDKRFCHDPAFLGVEQRLIMDVIDQIAEEIISDGT